jgi:ADP-ribose pyrophosphatase
LVEFPNGAQGGYLRLLYKSDFQKSAGVAILPIFHGNIVVNIQYRHAPRKWGFEITRGWGEPNELPIDAAEREILEEIGGEIDKIIDLGPYYPNTGVEGSEVKLFLAFMKDIGKTQLEEGIERYELLSIEKIKEMITQGKITDGFTIAAFARAFFKMLI